tara:strand:- start:8331 stop:8747 length:417 start_codon:yes stop_codon:yes gene_type:complete
MRDSIINKLKNGVASRASKKYTKKLEISTDSNMPMVNHKCQFNAVHAVKHKNAVAVIECIMIGDRDCTAHYINLMSDGRIIDYTLGWAWSGADYRFVRYVPDSEYENIDDSLCDLKKTLCGKLPWYCKLLRVDKWDLC